MLQRFTMISGFVVGTLVFGIGLHMAFFRVTPLIQGFSNLLLGGLFAVYGAFRLSRSWLMYRREQQERRRADLEDRYNNP